MALLPSFFRTGALKAVRQPVNCPLPGIVQPRGASIIALTWQEIAQIGPRLVRTEPTIAWPIGRIGSRTARSIATIASTDETRFVTKSTITRSTTSGPSIPVGPPCGSRVLIAGLRGARSPAGSAMAGVNLCHIAMASRCTTKATRFTKGIRLSHRPKSTRSRRKRSPLRAPEVAPDKAEWMPLGVFALTPDGQASGPDPTLFLQLAISKEGIIIGTLNNTATDKTQTIEGMADKTSQRCAWTVAGQTRPIMETGISNLTEDTAPALVHFADGQTQQWLMVRLEDAAAKQ